MPFAEDLIDAVFKSLDAKPENISYGYTVVPQLSGSDCKILVNSVPLASKPQLAEYWAKLPVSQHRLSSFDFHAIPGLNLQTFTVNGKVRFDESGKNKLNESADLVQLPPDPRNGTMKPRPVWGPWLGFHISMVVDGKASSVNSECIRAFNYKIVYVPEDSLIQV